MPDSIIERITDGQLIEPGIVTGVLPTPQAPATPSSSSTPQAPATPSSSSTADAQFTEPGIVAGVLPTPQAFATPSSSSPISATIAEQNPCVQDNKAATDAAAPPEPSATPDAATSSFTDATAIAAPAAIQAVIATIADIEARTAPIAAGLAERKDLLLKISIPTQGPSAPDRSPDTDPERDD